MKKRQKHMISKEDNLKTPSSSSSTLINNSSSKSTPTDLIFDIFSRLPAKSISRFRCLSKTWSSIFCRKDFTDQFLTMSSARPRLLFTYHDHHNNKLFSFSAPQPLNPDHNLCVVVDNHKPIPTANFNIHPSVRGLVCSNGWDTSRWGMMRVCNPSTGHLATFHPARTWSIIRLRTFLAYDPIKNEFKVLCVSYGRAYATAEYQVLTLGTRKLSWRMIECSINQMPEPDCGGICINGVLYYTAYRFPTVCIVVCFDVGSEKFTSIEINVTSHLTLINYKGKLGAIQFCLGGFFKGICESLELMVLDDAANHIWSTKTYIVPPLWKDLVEKDTTRLQVVGMTGDGEIVFAPCIMSGPFYVFYYNVERNTIARVWIQGINFVKYQYVYTFMDHVEDVRPMKVLLRSHQPR